MVQARVGAVVPMHDTSHRTASAASRQLHCRRCRSSWNKLKSLMYLVPLLPSSQALGGAQESSVVLEQDVVCCHNQLQLGLQDKQGFMQGLRSTCRTC